MKMSILRSTGSIVRKTNLNSIMQINSSFKRSFCEGMHERIIKMPNIMDSKTGTIDKWLKREGESFDAREPLCEVTLSEGDLRVGVEAPRAGVLAEILVEVNGTIGVDEPIAMFVDDLQEYMEHVEMIRIKAGEEEMMKEMRPSTDDKAVKSDVKVVLHGIRLLIKRGDIDPSTEFAKELQSLARKGNSDLLSIFEVSFEGEHFDIENFDSKFFLENAEDIVNESLEIKKSKH